MPDKFIFGGERRPVETCIGAGRTPRWDFPLQGRQGAEGQSQSAALPALDGLLTPISGRVQ